MAGRTPFAALRFVTEPEVCVCGSVGAMTSRKTEQIEAAGWFMQRAKAAMDAAEEAGSEDASLAFYKEAETWLYMAAKSLNPNTTARPSPLPAPEARVKRERRSFSGED